MVGQGTGYQSEEKSLENLSTSYTAYCGFKKYK